MNLLLLNLRRYIIYNIAIHFPQPFVLATCNMTHSVFGRYLFARRTEQIRMCDKRWATVVLNLPEGFASSNMNYSTQNTHEHLFEWIPNQWKHFSCVVFFSLLFSRVDFDKWICRVIVIQIIDKIGKLICYVRPFRLRCMHCTSTCWAPWEFEPPSPGGVREISSAKKIWFDLVGSTGKEGA